MAVGLNDRVPEYHDLWEVNLATGKRVLIEQNSQEFAGYDLDLELKPKLALKTLAEGGEIFRKAGGKWVSLLKFGQADSLTTATIGIEGSRHHSADAVFGGPRQVRAGARGSRHRKDHGARCQRSGRR